MNVEHLKVFHVLAKNNSFSKTAKALHMSQPSVSTQIRQLEKSLDVKLFDRTTKQVHLTSQGKILFDSAEEIFNLINQTKNKMALLSETIHGELAIGASLTLGEHILPYILGEFQNEFPNVNLEMTVNNSEHIIESLRNKQIQLAFIQSSCIYPEFTQNLLMEDELIIIRPHEFNDSSTQISDEFISTRTLFSLPMIIRESGSGTRQVIEEQLIKHHLDPKQLNVVLELENTESIKSVVESGMGISIISKASVQKELRLKTLRMLSVQGMHLKRNFYSVYDNENLTWPGNAFLSFIHNYYKPQ